MSYSFTLPFRAQLVGSTSSGKTYFTTKLLKHREALLSENLDTVSVFYTAEQSHYNKMQEYVPNITFYKGIPENLDKIIENLDCTKHHLFIFDDLMSSLFYKKVMLDLFISASHHKNISVLLIIQSLHLRTQLSRTIGLQTDVFIFFNNWRDKLDIKLFSKQVHPEKPGFILDSYIKALTFREYGYLVVNLQHKIKNSNFRVVTGIFPEENLRIFLKNEEYINDGWKKKFIEKKEKKCFSQ
jgi:hypothetical protein